MSVKTDPTAEALFWSVAAELMAEYARIVECTS